MIRKKLKKISFEYLILALGCFIMAISLNIFLVPNKIAPGGVTGIATVMFHLSHEKLPVGLTMLVLNIPLFLLGYKLIGRGFLFRTLLGSIILSIFVDITGPYTDYFLKEVDPVFSKPDLLLYSISGGFLLGIGLGLVFRVGATTGGTDLASALAHSVFSRIPTGQILLFIDGVVVVFAAISFGSLKLGLYAIISIYITSRVIDTMLEGVNFAKGLFIISDKWEDISTEILSRINRGVTAFYGKGLYSGEDKQILLCVVRRKEIQKVKSVVNTIDPDAFIFLTDIREVLGEGF